ncbi:hypothetical protein BKA70DRAFT_1370288 [Coprinopsis sp. MPI-PUGE-AT-0042]|nr:hypothetical protein BKA70DRAFT_1370288 [Coprinopsis sp. MPI-PUGE-AT-0042]
MAESGNAGGRDVARTGPPRSLPFAYSQPQSPAPRSAVPPSASENGFINPSDAATSDFAGYYNDRDEELLFSLNGPSGYASQYRTPLEHPRRETSGSSTIRDKGKQRSTDDNWLPRGLKWFQDPQGDKQESYFSGYTPAAPSGALQPNSLSNHVLTEEPAEDDDDTTPRDKAPTDDEAERHETPVSGEEKGKFTASLLKRRHNKPRSSSYNTEDGKAPHSLNLRDLPPESSNSKSISVPSSPKAPAHKKLLRRWSFSSHQKPSSMAAESRQGSRDDSAIGAGSRWNRLRTLLGHLRDEGAGQRPAKLVVSPNVNITDELITGGLAPLLPKLWFERDDKGQRRIPILLHRLRLKITDSLHPMHKTKSVFRIECEYANGASRWVVYKELKDFVALHSQYTFAHAANNLGSLGSRLHEDLPEFPTTSLPYFKFLNKDGTRKITKAEFARMQREQLEDYLISLIRAVMFHPSANRLAAFLEISALSIKLAQSGGAQWKAGNLRVEATSYPLSSKESGNSKSSTPPFGRKSAGWRERKEWRWFSVRESYLVGLEEPGELDVWDVFLLDSDFKIERPKRYYRQGLARRSARGEHSDTSSDDEIPRGAMTPLVDPSIHPNPAFLLSKPPAMNGNKEGDGNEAGATLDGNNNFQEASQSVVKKQEHQNKDVSRHTFYIVNSQMRLKIHARSERHMLQFIAALERTAQKSPFTRHNRFDSFAPIRLNVAAQWLVDGRDYFWNLSRAILLAKETIYIHDWWLSPEILMRRPEKERYRLDNLLERKAKEGVKIYVIIYLEVSNRTTPIDSNYTKQKLTGLHPNIMVQRSPSHFQTGTFYWAHHEKLCVIDQTIAFMGGLDLCFGRWDTPQHTLLDDTLDTDRPEIWPGKDYSNPRVSDFTNLNKPEEDMYDRSKVPRMPWHDVALQIVGQAARDLARHFVQRWNYLLRIKNHSVQMPFLLPPPEFRAHELHPLAGTCELQITRSAGPWSMGTPGRVEQSIQNAYLKAIQMSEHFVYIENQFFITSTTVNDIKVENRIGDALVQRIIRAHRDGTPWKCCVMVPLLPGFTFPVDHSDASAIRIILECQNRTIARGPDSIFSRLRKEGIQPEDYIAFFCLRNWGKLRGEVLTTEQVYIHAKICIVDDRLAIIGSANINERSMRGDRDSELAAVIRDTDMIDCTMAGKPFQVGRFAHTLRVRLMREHLGIDVDNLDQAEQSPVSREPLIPKEDQTPWDPDQEQEGARSGFTHETKARHGKRGNNTNTLHFAASTAEKVLHGAGDAVLKDGVMAAGVLHGDTAKGAGQSSMDKERTDYETDGQKREGFASSVVPTMEEQTLKEGRPRKGSRVGYAQHDVKRDVIQEEREDVSKSPNGDANGRPKSQLSGQPPASENGSLPDRPTASRSRSTLHLDNLAPRPSSEGEGRASSDLRSNLKRNASAKSNWTVPANRPAVAAGDFEDPICVSFWKDRWVASAVHNTEIHRKVFHAIPDDTIKTWKQYKEFVSYHERLTKPLEEYPTARLPSDPAEEQFINRATEDSVSAESPPEEVAAGEDQKDNILPPPPSSAGTQDTFKRKPAKGSEGHEQMEREQMEKLLNQLNGHLVVYPTQFLEGEDIANNFLFNADRLLPLPIYD